jgi:hypothetical protein
MPEVRKHLNNLFDRIRRPKAHGKTILVRARAITSPKETVEVQPFLVLSPSDIVTLVNSLFPERKSNPFGNRDAPKSGLTSSASSISGISIPAAIGSIGREGSSVLSQSVSSMTSDTTSKEQPQDYSEMSDHVEITAGQRDVAMIRPVPTEEYGRKLREACSDMSSALGAEVVAGTCHPCADRWAVLHISKDGKELLTRMRKDTDDDEPDEDSPDSDSDDEGSSCGMALENDYHQLKDAIIRLLSEYELPKVLSDPTAFSNGQSPRRERRSRQKRLAQGSQQDQSHSNSQISNLMAGQRLVQSRARRSSNPPENEDPSKTKAPDLVIMLEAAYEQGQSRGEYIDAHAWFKALEQLQKLQSPTLTRDGYGPLLHYFGRGPRDSLQRCFSAIHEFEAWFVWLKQSQERHEDNIERMMRNFKNLRDKMWYKTGVLTSSPYEEARNVALALRSMGKKLNPGEILSKPSPAHKRAFSRPTISGTTFLLKTESQVLDLLAAPNEQCGPNKLSDEQVEVTLKWLRDFNIERHFCQSEERIHRFNFEVDKCVNKLVADNVINAPVLWSSELFIRDREILDRGRTDVWLTGLGLCIPDADVDGDKNDKVLQASKHSLDFVQRPKFGSIRSLSSQASQHSYASSDWSGGTKAGVLNIMDAQDYFGGSSPAREIDSTVTFWSPFQTSKSQDNASSKERPMTTASAKSFSDKTPAALADEKRRFLLDLKRTLTGLLLSDLGMLVFNTGSETDAWFSEGIVDDCVKMKEADDRKRKQKLARKKSKRALKVSRELQRNGSASNNSNGSEGTSPATHVVSEQTSEMLDVQDLKKQSLDYPYTLAYRRLLQKFATHPNPFAKLDALFKVRLLIDQQLSAPSKSHLMKVLRDDQPTPRESPKPDTPTTTTHSGRGSPAARVSMPNSPAGMSSVIEKLQALLSDPMIRPKTLFRDLQYIAAFIPSDFLEKTVYGKAFEEVSIAAVGLKEDIVRYMVVIADRIVEEDTEGRSSSTAAAHQSHIQSSTTAASDTPTTGVVDTASVNPQQLVTSPQYTMSDAAHMYQIAALEGNAAAERELAIFYLTQPDITPRATQPLAKAKDVFKNLEKMISQRRSIKGGTEEDSKRSDPHALCLAHHWMEMSKAGGDELAAKYLRDREDMERIPGA